MLAVPLEINISVAFELTVSTSSITTWMAIVVLTPLSEKNALNLSFSTAHNSPPPRFISVGLPF